MVIPLSVPAFSLTAPALVDSGATDSFVDTTFAKNSGLPATRLKIPRSLRLFDGGLAHSGPITHFVVLDIRPPRGILKKYTFLLTTLDPSVSFVLSIDWLTLLNPRIDWKLSEMHFPLLDVS